MNVRRIGFWSTATWQVAWESGRAIPFMNWKHTTQPLHPPMIGTPPPLLRHFGRGKDTVAERVFFLFFSPIAERHERLLSQGRA